MAQTQPQTIQRTYLPRRRGELAAVAEWCPACRWCRSCMQPGGPRTGHHLRLAGRQQSPRLRSCLQAVQPPVQERRYSRSKRHLQRPMSSRRQPVPLRQLCRNLLGLGQQTGVPCKRLMRRTRLWSPWLNVRLDSCNDSVSSSPLPGRQRICSFQARLCLDAQAGFSGFTAGLFKEADANASGGLDRKEFRNVMRSIELGLSTA